MAQTLLDALSSLRHKIELSNERYLALKQECDLLKADNESLRRDLSSRDAEIRRLRNDAKFLAISHRLAQNPDTIVESRRHIAKLIRNIDTCISLLKE